MERFAAELLDCTARIIAIVTEESNAVNPHTQHDQDNSDRNMLDEEDELNNWYE